MAGVLAALAIAVWVVTYRVSGGQRVDATLALPALILAVILFSVAAPGRSYVRRPAAPGRVIAIIPAFNEDPDGLHGTIRSLLTGTRVPDEIHVVNDGSEVPVPEINHPRVFWWYQSNAGKRKAQALVLSMLRTNRADGYPVDFVLTVDSDSTVDRHAVHHLLEAMSDGEVQAATGLPLTRNRRRWLSRVIDLEIASICLTYRAARSMLGSLTTCSGALSMYRADLVLDNLDDYASSSWSAGDDRRLTHYAMLRGRVVSVSDAVVHTDMPSKVRQLYRQRVRWSTSHWRYFGWEIANLPTRAVVWTGYLTILYVIVPAALIWTLLIAPLLGFGLAWQVLAYWLGMCWMVNIKYVAGRPQMRLRERMVTWAVGTPLLIVVHLLVLRPAMLHALFRTLFPRTRTTTWSTRAVKLTSGRHRASPAVPGRYRKPPRHKVALAS